MAADAEIMKIATACAITRGADHRLRPFARDAGDTFQAIA
jgi:hypothetical protein